jgi:hypothetical protein
MRLCCFPTSVFTPLCYFKRPYAEKKGNSAKQSGPENNPAFNPIGNTGLSFMQEFSITLLLRNALKLSAQQRSQSIVVATIISFTISITD